jgi:hypothetical protein
VKRVVFKLRCPERYCTAGQRTAGLYNRKTVLSHPKYVKYGYLKVNVLFSNYVARRDTAQLDREQLDREQLDCTAGLYSSSGERVFSNYAPIGKTVQLDRLRSSRCARIAG